MATTVRTDGECADHELSAYELGVLQPEHTLRERAQLAAETLRKVRAALSGLQAQRSAAVDIVSHVGRMVAALLAMLQTAVTACMGVIGQALAWAHAGQGSRTRQWVRLPATTAAQRKPSGRRMTAGLAEGAMGVSWTAQTLMASRRAGNT